MNERTSAKRINETDDDQNSSNSTDDNSGGGDDDDDGTIVDDILEYHRQPHEIYILYIKHSSTTPNGESERRHTQKQKKKSKKAAAAAAETRTRTHHRSLTHTHTHRHEEKPRKIKVPRNISFALHFNCRFGTEHAIPLAKSTKHQTGNRTEQYSETSSRKQHKHTPTSSFNSNDSLNQNN